MSTKKKNENLFNYVSEAEVKELVEVMLGDAFREHSRQLEAHLRSIHDRIQNLETTRR